MSIVHLDGFDSYSSYADLSTEYTMASSSCMAVSPAVGRFSGGAVILSTNSGYLTKYLSTTMTEIWAGYAANIASLSSSCGALFQVFGTAGMEFTFAYYNGTIKMFRGNNAGTLVSTTVATISSSIWHWLEFRYKYSATVGVAELWCDGVQLATYSGNTTNAGSGSITYIRIGDATYYTNMTVDDLYILDATTGANTTRLGDCKIETLVPTSDASPNNGSVTGVVYYSPSLATYSQISLGYLYQSPAVAAPYTGTMTGWAIHAVGSYSGNIIVAIYDNSGNVLATSTVLVALVPGWNAFTFTTPLSVVAGTLYKVAIQTTMLMNAYNPSTSLVWNVKSFSYNTTFPTNPSGLSPASSWNFAWVYSAGAPNYTGVNEGPIDSIGYVSIPGTSGQEELYGMSDLASSPYQVFAARVVAATQKTDAGPVMLEPVVVSSGTESDGSAAPVIYGTWTRQYTIYETDPHTGVAWTGTGINAAQVGVKVA